MPRARVTPCLNKVSNFVGACRDRYGPDTRFSISLFVGEEEHNFEPPTYDYSLQDWQAPIP